MRVDKFDEPDRYDGMNGRKESKKKTPDELIAQQEHQQSKKKKKKRSREAEPDESACGIFTRRYALIRPRRKKEMSDALRLTSSVPTEFKIRDEATLVRIIGFAKVSYCQPVG